MTIDEPAAFAATLAAVATVATCMETGDFGPGLEAMERVRAAGGSTRPATQMLADTCFQLELRRWSRVGATGSHFPATALLREQSICTAREVNAAIVAALVARADEQGFLEGDLHTMLTKVATESGSEIFVKLAKKIRRGDDSGFTA